MSIEGRKTRVDITIEPWGFEDQLFGPIGSIFLRDSKFSSSSDQKNNDQSIINSLEKRAPTPTSNTPKKKLAITNPKTINFVKKNQESLKSHSLLTNNYSSELSEEMSAFAPLGLRTPIPIIPRKTAVNTMCIGYYDRNPFLLGSEQRSKSNKVPKCNSPSPRPQTSEAKSYQTRVVVRSSKSSPRKSKIEIYEEPEDLSNEIHSTNNRLQKMLKIKQKLRQKLKKVSQQRDIERGLNSKKTMRIDENENEEHKEISLSRSKQVNTVFCKKRTYQEQQKWKLFNKYNKSQRQSPREQAEKFFVILGNPNMEK